MPLGALESAQLLVVQPGSRRSFRHRVMEAMRAIAPSTGSFVFLATQDFVGLGDGGRWVAGRTLPMSFQEPWRLSEAFRFNAADVVASARRAYRLEELFSDEERLEVPFLREFSVPQGLRYGVWVFLHEGGVLFGLAGLERGQAEGPFSDQEVEALERVASFAVAGCRFQMACDEAKREAAAMRALGKVSGTLYAIDRERRQVIWAADRQRGIQWDEDVSPYVDALVDAAEQYLSARASGQPLPTPPRLAVGSVVAVAKLEGDSVFGTASKCAVVRVESPHEAAPKVQRMEGLSKREREIARLLIAGYSGVNVAAIVGLSENTVRTYVRRLYQKLDVSNRADLVRRLVSPDPKSVGPSSVLGPPPDSSLLEGDETLDEPGP